MSYISKEEGRKRGRRKREQLKEMNYIFFSKGFHKSHVTSPVSKKKKKKKKKKLLGFRFGGIL